MGAEALSLKMTALNCVEFLIYVSAQHVSTAFVRSVHCRTPGLPWVFRTLVSLLISRFAMVSTCGSKISKGNPPCGQLGLVRLTGWKTASSEMPAEPIIN